MEWLLSLFKIPRFVYLRGAAFSNYARKGNKMKSESDAVLLPFQRERDYMEDRVAQGIARNRMGHGRIRVVDAAGHPVPGARVVLRQRGHEFKVGANLFMLDEFQQDWKNQEYRRLFGDAFNIATVPFYWGDLEPEQGKPRFAKDSPRVYRRPAPDLCLEYCQEKGITPKGHCLVYEPFRPKWLPTEDINEIKRLYDRRIREIGDRYRDAIPMWEVTNETMYTHHSFGYSAFFRADDHVEWSFQTARRHLPLNQLIINDANEKIFKDFTFNRGQFYLQIEKLLREGVPVNGVGMQFHLWGPREEYPQRAETYLDPRLLYDVMDTYGHFGLPIQITEITLPCYERGAEMENLQAEILKNLCRIWFSHEAMEAVIYWNLVDGGAFGSENALLGGLIREDMTPKPAFRAIQELFQKTWHTELDLGTDDGGYASWKGFYGDYDVEITQGGRSHRFRAPWLRSGLRDLTFKLDEGKE